jgi:hypothetical protein
MHVLRTVISSLPARLSAPAKGNSDKAALEGEYALLRRRIAELDRQANNLMIDADIHKRLYGEDRWRKACEENAAGLANLNAQAEDLLEAVDAPDYAETRAIIERIRAIGLDRFWALADVHVRRELLRRMIERIDVDASPPTHKCWKSVTVKLRAPFERYCDLRSVQLHDVIPHHVTANAQRKR